jgi:SAM-dependent methyltransferase
MLLLIGGDDTQAKALRHAGYRVERHHLDPGPLAQPPGIPFTPPVVVWPFGDASYDAVILLDELAHTVLEEEALAEASRVLRPGGVLLLRVPLQGRLAWLDGFNVYRYVRDISRRGQKPPETAGIGWRRHYRRDDVAALLEPHFSCLVMQAAGLGLSDVARAMLLLFWRWVLVSSRGDAAIRDIPARILRLEGRWSPLGFGYSIVVAAERHSSNAR